MPAQDDADTPGIDKGLTLVIARADHSIRRNESPLLLSARGDRLHEHNILSSDGNEVSRVQHLNGRLSGSSRLSQGDNLDRIRHGRWRVLVEDDPHAAAARAGLTSSM